MVEARLGALLPFTSTVPADGGVRSPITRSSVDFPHPDGPISETNSPGSIDRSISCSAVTLPFAKVFVSPFERDDRHAMCSGARCTTSFSAITITTKNEMPRQAAIRFVAQRFAGVIE